MTDSPSPATDDETTLASWLRLTLTHGLGPVTGQQLLRHIGPPEAIFSTPQSRLATLCSPKIAHALLAADPQREHLIERTLNWLAQGQGRRLLALDDPDYPQALLHLSDPPLLIHAQGNLAALNQRAIAIVGSRNASPEGMRNAFGFAEALARRQWLITSGLAEGIDSAAHQGALAGAGTDQPPTIAVIGNGLDQIYPARHRQLAERILANQGLILTEQPLGAAPLRSNFPRRNRMIAALSRGVLVVEAAVRSGSLISARLGAELGREIMAVPGSIHNPLARGCHHLIRDGAALIETVDDILRALGEAVEDESARAGSRRRPSRRQDHHDDPDGDDIGQLLKHLQGGALSAEALAAQLKRPIDQVLVTIQLAEIQGRIARQSDGRWQGIHSG